jgi:hypothetical protein
MEYVKLRENSATVSVFLYLSIMFFSISLFLCNWFYILHVFFMFSHVYQARSFCTIHLIEMNSYLNLYYSYHTLKFTLRSLSIVQHALIKKKTNFPHIKGNSDGIGCKVIYEEGLPNIWGNAQQFSPYMRRSCTRSLWISYYMREILFYFLSVWSASIRTISAFEPSRDQIYTYLIPDACMLEFQGVQQAPGHYHLLSCLVASRLQQGRVLRGG